MKPANEPQLSFRFNDPEEPASDYSMKILDLPDADVVFFPNYFTKEQSDIIFKDLLEKSHWNQEKTKYYGKEVNIPRLTAWHGDNGASYTYSHIANAPQPWTAPLIFVKNRIERVANASFNSVLLNLYRSGADGVSWHQDNEKELGENPVIASVSFGGTRRFQFRHKFRKELPRVDVNLTHGSLLIMKGTTQQFWQHQIPKTSKPVEPRINLTFRVIR